MIKTSTLVMALTLSFLAVPGCKTGECSDDGECVQSSALGVSFNDQQYVWEGFIFSTNRVQKVK